MYTVVNNQKLSMKRLSNFSFFFLISSHLLRYPTLCGPHLAFFSRTIGVFIVMAYLLPHLRTGWAVDQAILNEGDRVVVMRFGHDHDPTCMITDEVLCGIADDVKNFAVIYVVDITEVPDFNTMYELYDPCTVMFFYRNKHIMVDLGTGNNNKINWAFNNKQEMIDIIETVYRGARKGRGLVISPKDYSTKYRS
jgi:DIM1 family U5 snRNP protein